MINEENNVSSIIVPIPLNIVVSDSYSRTISANNGYKLIKEKKFESKRNFDSYGNC